MNTDKTRTPVPKDAAGTSPPDLRARLTGGVALDTAPVYTVAEAAERTGLSAHTLRYYERAGLMLPVGRVGDGAHRRYSERDLAFLEFLKRLRATGMGIAEMRRYVALVVAGDGTLEERRRMLTEHGERVRTQIDTLREALSVVEWKVEHYRRLGLGPPGAADDCTTNEKEENR